MSQYEMILGHGTYELQRVFQNNRSVTDLLMECLEENRTAMREVDEKVRHDL